MIFGAKKAGSGANLFHEIYEKACRGQWVVLLTPTKPVPHRWFGDLKGKKVLGLASGGGQLEAGLIPTDLYEDANGTGKLREYNIPSFWATRAVKKHI